MNIWIVIVGVLVVAFASKAIYKLMRRKRKGYHSDLSTRNKRKLFINRFKHLEGLGD